MLSVFNLSASFYHYTKNEGRVFALTLPDVAVLDLLLHLGPHGRVNLAVRLDVLGLEPDDLREATTRVADPAARGRRRLRRLRGRRGADRVGAAALLLLLVTLRVWGLRARPQLRDGRRPELREGVRAPRRGPELGHDGPFVVR